MHISILEKVLIYIYLPNLYCTFMFVTVDSNIEKCVKMYWPLFGGTATSYVLYIYILEILL